jgi:hypothetical protein
MATTDVFEATYGPPWVPYLRCRCGRRLEPGDLMLVDSPDHAYGKTTIIGCPACRPGADPGPAAGPADDRG